jgi:glycosyltransferase involved in cell wall biosynthesis
MRYSVVIATYNRAADLRGTLRSLAALQPDGAWEAIIVDNKSTDDTRSIVEEAARTFPVPLRYLFEREQGRSPALNAGIRAAGGDVIVTTDDDVRVEPDWLNRAGAALERLRCDYVGGRVLPIWGGPKPDWLPNGGKHWAVIALLDFGAEPIEFGVKVPLGVNMAFRRSAFDRAGLFDPHTGRKAGTLLGQEVREWCMRAGAAGVRGFYAPELALRHIIPASRLRKAYFRRWFYWRGISRARLYQTVGLDMEAPERTTLDFHAVPHIFGVPRYLYRKAVASIWHSVAATFAGNRIAAFDHELWVWFFAGICAERWRRRSVPAREAATPARAS